MVTVAAVAAMMEKPGKYIKYHVLPWPYGCGSFFVDNEYLKFLLMI
jgi:hypothetical protein